ncbi:hypothetical protein ElyMa_001125400 [Elysia marginata]|uniref:Transmembrane protein n=1 Tax=Elysia marginata TaxID=1093978 RepID=A0AAV4HWD4_9GAST|nr:hypothetical protein ElyMa_001125400 [Elysia marginata]
MEFDWSQPTLNERKVEFKTPATKVAAFNAFTTILNICIVLIIIIIISSSSSSSSSSSILLIIIIISIIIIIIITITIMIIIAIFISTMLILIVTSMKLFTSPIPILIRENDWQKLQVTISTLQTSQPPSLPMAIFSDHSQTTDTELLGGVGSSQKFRDLDHTILSHRARKVSGSLPSFPPFSLSLH